MNSANTPDSVIGRWSRHVSGEVDDAVSWYERNASTGALTYGGMLKYGVNGVDGVNGAYRVTYVIGRNHAYADGGTDDAVSWYDSFRVTTAKFRRDVNRTEWGVDGLDGAFSVTLSSDGNHAYAYGLQ